MRVLRPGQSYEGVTVQVVILDGQQAHAWELTHANVSWDMSGLGPTGRTTAKVRMEGELRRKTKQLPQREELE